ncbi:hypothetical protein [Georgenia deserti]|uniref:ABC transporter permease subunit n=1 Tax=Georgenia deserti TaxID=2093781 RepID=A0ABW4L754_9MICO
MLEILRNTARLVSARWPELLVFALLGGFLSHIGILGVATLAAIHRSALLGALLLPLPILAELGAYVGMFLVLRRHLPHYGQRAAAGELEIDVTDSAGSRRHRRADSVTTFASQVIVPFFVLYSAWNYLDDDLERYRFEVEWRIFDVPAERLAAMQLQFTLPAVALLAAALVARLVVHRLRHRLPAWISFVDVYLEGLWVFLATMLVFEPLQELPRWLGGREFVVWLSNGWQGFLDAVPFLDAAWRTVAVPVAGFLIETVGVLALPVAWLAITGIVLARRLGGTTVVDLVTARSPHLRQVRERNRRLPGVVRFFSDELTEDYRARADVLVDVGRVVTHAGAVTLAGFVLTYVALETMTSWAFRGIVALIGPQDLDWWQAVFPMVSIGVHAVSDVVQIALLAATFDHCLGRLPPAQAPPGRPATSAAPARTEATPSA